MDFIVQALEYIANTFDLIKGVIYGIFEFATGAFTYLYYLLIKVGLWFKLESLKMAYSIANMLLADYEVYAVLNSMFNNLSPDLRYAAFELGVVEAVRIVIDALATAFVLRVMGW